MEASLRFYIDGLGFRRTKKWVVDGKIRWCWLEIGHAAIMLQEYCPEKIPSNKRGEGVSICFQCRDALAIYHHALSRGLEPQRPFVGNNMWVSILTDPDGYKLDFESPRINNVFRAVDRLVGSVYRGGCDPKSRSHVATRCMGEKRCTWRKCCISCRSNLNLYKVDFHAWHPRRASLGTQEVLGSPFWRPLVSSSSAVPA